MDDSLTNLMNESQKEEDKYFLELDINEKNRNSIKNVLFLFGFIINFTILFIDNIVSNIILYLSSLILFTIGLLLIHKNYNYFKNNIILLNIYIISIIFQFILIINNKNNTLNLLSLIITILYQMTYVVNYE
tara:strand:- start:1288 stop:1683 length:396 start_codon:yes stop_codon:yes gene_type:complete